MAYDKLQPKLFNCDDKVILKKRHDKFGIRRLFTISIRYSDDYVKLRGLNGFHSRHLFVTDDWINRIIYGVK